MLHGLGRLTSALALVHLGAFVLAVQERENVAAAPAAAPVPLPQAWDTSYVVLLESNADYRPATEHTTSASISSTCRPPMAT